MREIEVKILNINVEEIRKKLLELGATKVFEGEVHAIAFDFPDSRLDQQDCFVRLRKVGDKTELCFKGEKADSKFKSREEIEVNVSEFDETIKILEKIGLKRFHEGRKNRISYKFEGATFELDSWENIPTFLEIEAKTEEEVESFVNKLGFTMEQTNNWSYLDIEEHYKNEQKNKTTQAL